LNERSSKKRTPDSTAQEQAASCEGKEQAMGGIAMQPGTAARVPTKQASDV
jgi:hypothetical protein